MTSRRPSGRLLAQLAVTAVAATVAAAVPAAPAGAAVPPTPAGLPAAAEAWQPYVGQTTCDPVAKPGVRAFSTMVLKAYPETTSLGIVRDCGIGGQSEHKEGRAFDWGVASSSPAQVAAAREMLDWLLATDSNGNVAAMARRLGIMYMVYNRQIWKSYAADKGWAAYSGPNPHTDHVHISFGWNGARQVTSYWTGRVAPVDYGPGAAGRAPKGSFDVLTTSSTATRAVGWAADPDTPAPVDVVLTAAGTTRRVRADVERPDVGTAYPELGSAHGFSVPLDDLPDGDQNVCLTAINASGTGGADTSLGCRTVTVRHAAVGTLDSVSSGPDGTWVRGWALDRDAADPVDVRITVDGGSPRTVRADGSRPDVGAAFPGSGERHGFAVDLTDVADGERLVCVTAVNLPGTIGASTSLGCRDVLVRHDAAGYADAVEVVAGGARVRGWAGDPDTAGTLAVTATSGPLALGGVSTGLSRPDVAAAAPWLGSRTGFDGRLPLTALPEGPQPVCLTARSALRGRDAALGCTTVQVRHVPFGSADLFSPVPGGLRAAGWATEPDTDAAATVRVSTSYGAVSSVAAALPRPDVASALPAFGGARGFDATVPTPAVEGVQRICADVVNAGPGRDQRLACRDVTVRHAPLGQLDAARFDGTARLQVQGWALDPDVAAPVEVHVYVDGVYAGRGSTGTARPDVAAAYPAWGGSRGVDVVLSGSWRPGDRRVCLYAIDAGGSGTQNPELGCRTVPLG